MKTTIPIALLAVMAGVLGFAIGSALVLALWNLVLVPVVAAAGLGSLDKIGFWTAAGINLLLVILQGMVRR